MPSQIYTQTFHYIRARFNKFTETLYQYGALIKLITTDSVWRFKKESVTILITGFFGVFFQVWTIGLAIYYASSLEEGGTIKLLHYTFETRTSLKLLFLLGIAVLLSLLVSAWLIYFSRTKSLNLRRTYEEFCSKRVLSLFGSSLNIWAPGDKGFGDNGIICRLARTDSRIVSRVLWLLLDTIIPAITLVIAIGVLFYINPALTFLILVLSGISSIFQYRINVMGAKSSSLREKYARGASQEYQQIILRQKETAIPLPEDKTWFEQRVFATGDIKRYLDAYLGRLKAIENSQFISNILFAITIFVILLSSGASIIHMGEGWSKLIIYLVALRFGLINMKQTSKKITSINRFYPQVKRYFQFIGNTRFQAKRNEEPYITYSIFANTNPIKGSLDKYVLSRGNRLGLLSTVDLNRYTLAFIMECLLGRSQQAVQKALGTLWFGTSKHPGLPGSLRQTLHLPQEYRWRDLREEMGETGLWNRLSEQLPRNLDKPVHYDVWNRVEPDLKFALGLLYALRSNHQWVVIEEKGLHLLPRTAREFFLKRLSDRITVIVYNQNIMSVGAYHEDVIAVLSGNSVIGLGNVDWFKANQEQINQIFPPDFSEKSKKIYSTGNSDDEHDVFDDEEI